MLRITQVTLPKAPACSRPGARSVILLLPASPTKSVPTCMGVYCLTKHIVLGAHRFLGCLAAKAGPLKGTHIPLLMSTRVSLGTRKLCSNTLKTLKR